MAKVVSSKKVSGCMWTIHSALSGGVSSRICLIMPTLFQVPSCISI